MHIGPSKNIIFEFVLSRKHKIFKTDFKSNAREGIYTYYGVKYKSTSRFNVFVFQSTATGQKKKKTRDYIIILSKLPTFTFHLSKL